MSRRARTILKIVGGVLGALVVVASLLFYLLFGGKAPIPDGMTIDRVRVVKDGFVSVYLLDLAPGAVALVDSGNDPDATAILEALRKRGLGPEAVKAVLLTHGDADHTSGSPRFPQAMVMALDEAVPFAEGRAVRGPFEAPKPTGIRVGRVLQDGELLNLEGSRIEVFAVPGHAPGSAAFLAGRVLFLGDNAEVTSDSELEPAAWLFCDDRVQNRASLLELARRLESRTGVTAIACSHSGVLARGLEPLVELERRLSRRGRR